MNNKPQVRLPIDPLLAQSEGNLLALSRQLGIHHRKAVRWSHLGVPFYNADICACRIGLHPSALWDWNRASYDQRCLEEEHEERKADAAMRKYLKHLSPKSLRERRELVLDYERLERVS